MARFELSEQANADLQSIAAYTEATWGEKQRETYLELLEISLDKLAERPHLGRKRPELGEALRSYPAGSHVVFYVEMDFGIAVVRILHKRQEPSRHLPTLEAD